MCGGSNVPPKRPIRFHGQKVYHRLYAVCSVVYCQACHTAGNVLGKPSKGSSFMPCAAMSGRVSSPLLKEFMGDSGDLGKLSQMVDALAATVSQQYPAALFCSIKSSPLGYHFAEKISTACSNLWWLKRKTYPCRSQFRYLMVEKSPFL